MTTGALLNSRAFLFHHWAGVFHQKTLAREKTL